MKVDDVFVMLAPIKTPLLSSEGRRIVGMFLGALLGKAACIYIISANIKIHTYVYVYQFKYRYMSLHM
jgi:hypothetical protein